MDWGTLATQVPLVVIGLVVAWAMYKLWFVPGPLHQREVKRADSIDDENRKLRNALEEKVLPALFRSADLTEEAVRVLDSTVDMLERTNDSLGLLDEGLQAIQALREEAKQMHREVREFHERTAATHDRVVAVLQGWE